MGGYKHGTAWLWKRRAGEVGRVKCITGWEKEEMLLGRAEYHISYRLIYLASYSLGFTAYHKGIRLQNN